MSELSPPGRKILFDLGPIDPCGDRWLAWIDDGALHIGLACDDCQRQMLKVVLEAWPNLKVTEVFDQ